MKIPQDFGKRGTPGIEIGVRIGAITRDQQTLTKRILLGFLMAKMGLRGYPGKWAGRRSENQHQMIR